MCPLSRRQFVADGSLASLLSLFPHGVFADTAKTQKFVVKTDAEIAPVRPEFHGHFAEHLGSCIYGGLWVGRNSKVPNINGHRKLAVDYLKELGVPVLRWPGGCFADDYHWREGIGPAERRPKRVNIHWGGYLGLVTAGLAGYLACAEVCEASYGRPILPLHSLAKR